MAKSILNYFKRNTSTCVRHLSLNKKDVQIKTCGIIVIGDELLKGEVVDTNSSYMTTRLHNLGVQVKKISVVGDVIDDIVEDIKNFSNNYSYVITTGGIGPTHDDITFEAVAKTFNEPLELHPELVKLCVQFYKTTDQNAPGMKLARIPKSATLYFPTHSKLNYPNICVKNVYMFPGIPQLFERSFDQLSPTLFKSPCRFFTKNIYCKVNEDALVAILNGLAQEYPNVLIGSYPQLFHTDYKVKITITSIEENVVTEVYNKLLQTFPEDSVVKNYES